MNTTDSNTEIIFYNQEATVFVNGQRIGFVSCYTNKYHSNHCYLNLHLEHLDKIDEKHLFTTIRQTIRKPLQVMISSSESDIVCFLKRAGFVCKRRCYEVEAPKSDYIGIDSSRILCCSKAGEHIYEQCCEMLFDHYIFNHQQINPWTGTKQDFIIELPDMVYCEIVDNKVRNLAFVEENEIAYVFGQEIKEFRLFAMDLINHLFKQYDTITFEADDCDEPAMEMKKLFTNQSEESFDTYIL